MKKIHLYIAAGIVAVAIPLSIYLVPTLIKAADGDKNSTITDIKPAPVDKEDVFPEFYRGIYLTITSANDINRLKTFVEAAKRSYVNCMVLDVQSAKYTKCIVPKENVQFCINNDIHPIARIVIFPDGLKYFPVSEQYIKDKLDIAESACKNGFREIQFDYIRFNDSGRNKNLTLNDRYKFIEGFIARARQHLKKYNVRIAADVFGRVPLNTGDIIGQRMEGMDEVVDIICPMAYPSHYTWSKRLMNDPYYTVLTTSQKANERTKKALVVPYIQAFRMKLGAIPYERYVADQLRAVHDAGVDGWLMWNARQDYRVPLQVAKEFYDKRSNNPQSAK